jgi:uncharacterized protein with GYD domain
MASYLMLFSYTHLGIENIKDSPVLIEAIKKTIRRMGGAVEAFYGVLGAKFDTMFIVKAPGDEKIAEMALAIARLGGVRTQTHRLFSQDEFKEIISSLP